MGIQTSEAKGSALFLKINAKEGAIQYTKTDENGKPVKDEGGKNVQEFAPPASRIVGAVVGVKLVEDEYNGEKNFKVRVSMADPVPGQPRMVVDFPFGSEAKGASFFGLQLMGKLNNCDLAKPVALMPWKLAAGTPGLDGQPLASDRTGVTVYQDDKKITENFGTAESPEDRLPERRKTVIRGKEQVDPTDTSWDAKAEEVFQSLVSKLQPAPHEVERGAAAEDEIDVGEAAAAAEAAGGAAPAARPRFGGGQ